MAVRPVRIWPDAALTTPAEAVVRFDVALKQLIDDLFATMYAEKGIGLAANQIGTLLRVLVIDLDPLRERSHDAQVDEELRHDNFTGPIALVNPRIVASRGTLRWDEGCLSVPGVTETVTRRAHVTVAAQDAAGQPLRFEAHGLFAVCLQHEMDHLDGRVFVEYLSQLKRDVIRRKLSRQRHEEGPRRQRAAG